MSHTLIFVSSYFDFVRIRNYFKREEAGFVQICEYTKVSDKQVEILYLGYEMINGKGKLEFIHFLTRIYRTKKLLEPGTCSSTGLIIFCCTQNEFTFLED